VQHVVVCCSVLQCVARSREQECQSFFPPSLWSRTDQNDQCSVVQFVAVCCSGLQCVAVCCSVRQCAAVCCSVLCCSMLQCMQRVAMYCTVLQCAAMCCNWWSRRFCSQSERERVCERKTERDNTIQQAREQQRARAREVVGI